MDRYMGQPTAPPPYVVVFLLGEVCTKPDTYSLPPKTKESDKAYDNLKSPCLL